MLFILKQAKREFVINLHEEAFSEEQPLSPKRKHRKCIIMKFITLIVYDPVHKYLLDVHINLPNAPFLN